MFVRWGGARLRATFVIPGELLLLPRQYFVAAFLGAHAYAHVGESYIYLLFLSVSETQRFFVVVVFDLLVISFCLAK